MTQPIGPQTSATNRVNDADADVPASYPPPSPLNCTYPSGPLPPIPESLARAVAIGAATTAAPDARVQASLDRFMMSTEGPYQTPDGSQQVSPPFRMRSEFSQERADVVRAHAPLVEQARVHAGLTPGDVQAVKEGRGTPDQVRRLTQAVIDVSGQPPTGRPWTPLNIRLLMLDCGIGFDCAGYTQQAYLSTRGQTRAQAGFGPLADESLSNLEQQGFTRVPDVEHLRAGDIMVLGPPAPGGVGHRCIVYDSRPATPAEINELYETKGDAHDFSLTPPIYVMQLDSSWGANGTAVLGGVQRQTFFYSGDTGQWARYAPPLYNDPVGWPRFVYTNGPYDHPLQGFYRGPATTVQP